MMGNSSRLIRHSATVITALTLLLFPLFASAQVFRCPDGSYRHSCSGGDPLESKGLSTFDGPRNPPKFGEPSLEKPPKSTTERAPQYHPRESALERRNRLVKARARGIILMGMEERDVIRILGKPEYVRTSQGYGATCRDLHWKKRGRWTDYVRMCGGKVEYHSAKERP